MSTLKLFHILAAKIVFIVFIFLKAQPLCSQRGCTDSSANNYDPTATINDGSCNYNVTNYIPRVIVDPISDTLVESSGLQWVENSLWSFNDKGGTPDLYRIDTASKAILQIVRLKGASNVDWEEVSYDGTYFYVGDFGNNADGARTDLKIYKFPYSAIPDYTTKFNAAIEPEQIEVLNFKYSDQEQLPVPVALDSTKFDCEAMIIDNGKIHLFTKDWINYTSTHYVINSTLAGDYIATPVDTLDTGYLVTAASKSPGKNLVALLGYQDGGFGNHFIHLLSDYSGDKYFNGNKRKINLPTASEMGQAEGITFKNGNYGYISNERVDKSFGPIDITVNQKLRSFDISNFVPAIVLSVELENFSVNKTEDVDRIVWKFSSPVYNVKIEHSSDGIHFAVLKTYSVSKESSFSNKSINNINYYRIAWKGNTNEVKYSKVIRLENEEKSLLKKVLLKAGGELSFVLDGSREQRLSLKLFTTDGKDLSQIAARSYKPGINKINFPGFSALNKVVLLTAYGNEQKITIPIHIVQ